MLRAYTLIHPVKHSSALNFSYLDTIILKIALFPPSLSYEYLAGPITCDMLLELGTNLNASTNQNFSLCMENACRKSQFYEYKKVQ